MRCIIAKLPHLSLKISLVLISIPLVTGAVWAQSFPNKPLRIVLMFPAGGGSSDPQARLVALKLRDELGQSVIIENKPGGGGIIAADSVKSAPADGYTLVHAGVAMMTLTPKLNSAAKYTDADFTPVVSFGTLPNVLIARSEFPANNFTELVALAKKQPGEFNYGTWGPGSVPHLAGEWIDQEMGIKLNPIPYKGEVPLIQDMLGGQISLGWSSIASALPYIRSGQFKVLGITSSSRHPMLPNVKTFIEQGMPNFTIQGWTGLFVRKGTPKEVIDLLHAKLSKVLQLPELQAHATSVGQRLSALTIDQFSELIKTDANGMRPTLERLAPSLRQ